MTEKVSEPDAWDAGFDAGVMAVIERIIFLLVGDEQDDEAEE